MTRSAGLRVARGEQRPVDPPLPVALALPLAGPGCDLFVVPDIVEVLIASPLGDVQSTVSLTGVPVGLTFYHQMISIEIDPFFNFLAVSATNAVANTVGTF